MIFLNLILNCLLSWMFKELFIFFYLNLLMQHILCHRTCLDLHSFALPNISCCVSNTKEWRIFLALQQEVLDSFWSEQQTLEGISSSNTDHENARPLHLVTSSSSECYELPCKSLVNKHYCRKKTLISLIQWEELQ